MLKTMHRYTPLPTAIEDSDSIVGIQHLWDSVRSWFWGSGFWERPECRGWDFLVGSFQSLAWAKNNYQRKTFPSSVSPSKVVVTPFWFLQPFRHVLSLSSISPAYCSGQSFKIGVATSALCNGIRALTTNHGLVFPLSISALHPFRSHKSQIHPLMP